MNQEITMPEPERPTPPKKGPGLMPLIVVAIVVIAAVGGIFAYNAYLKPDLTSKAVSATLVIDYGNGTMEWYNITTANNSVPGILDAAIGDGNYNMSRHANGVSYFMNINGYGELQQAGYAVNASVPPGGWKSWRYYLDGNLAPNITSAFEGIDQFAIIRDGQTVRLAWETPMAPSGIFTNTGISVTMLINYGNGTEESYTVITQNFTVLGSLEAAVGYGNLTLTEYSWGALIDGINGITTGSAIPGIDDTSNYYWFWYVNGDFAMVGASQYVLQDGDVIEWSFEESAW